MTAHVASRIIRYSWAGAAVAMLYKGLNHSCQCVYVYNKVLGRISSTNCSTHASHIMYQCTDIKNVSQAKIWGITAQMCNDIDD